MASASELRRAKYPEEAHRFERAEGPTATRAHFVRQSLHWALNRSSSFDESYEVPPLPATRDTEARTFPASVDPVRLVCASSQSQMVKSIVVALALEKQAVRAQQRHQHVGLVNGEYLGRAKDRQAYRFRLDADLTAVDGSPARLRHRDRWHDAVVVSTSGRVVVLNVAEQLQGSLASALLQTDASFLLQHLVDRWRTADSDETFNWSLVKACLESVDLSERVPKELPARGHQLQLNERQARVIDTAFSTARTYLWGPPGTGKTTAVAALVHELVQAGSSVLLVSNTNAALDTAVLRVVTNVGLEAHSVVRVGGGAEGGLIGQSPPILLHEVMAQRGSSLAHSREAAGLQLLEARKRLKGLRQERDDCAGELQALSRLKDDQVDGVAAAALRERQLAAANALSERLRKQLARQERQAAGTGGKPSAALLRDARLCEADVIRTA